MKKYILIIYSALLISCSNDDNLDSIVGQWAIIERTVNGIDNPLGECEPFGILTFNEDGTFSVLLYVAIANTNCLDNPTSEFTGTWANDNNTYIVTSYNIADFEDGLINIIIEFETSNSIVITTSDTSDPNNSFTVTERYQRI